ncbi:MAG: RDD family protein [Deltaproteobacteria bacterium]|nr:RDD family protein [Deltaproteobacteria bacterium]
MTEASVPADWQTRSLALLINLILFITLFYGLGATYHFWGVFLSMIYIVFRDGIFSGQSIGKKVMGIRVVHMDGRSISFVDSSFRNVLFLIPYALPLALVVETAAMFRSPDRLRLGDRIAKTRVIRKEAVPALA